MKTSHLIIAVAAIFSCCSSSAMNLTPNFQTATIIPKYEADFFEFDIPRAATADGKLRLWFKKQAGIGEGPRPEVALWRNTGGWGTLVSEIWLMKIMP
ncbi:MAG TPA: hypothetical protein ENN29_06480 [Candidatus Hydrogenedentes bacterium]|mgnify:CR=1 FL=1|nr:hypothetical protein [Candidatus Hydrogenedentota bacterium]